MGTNEYIKQMRAELVEIAKRQRSIMDDCKNQWTHAKIKEGLHYETLHFNYQWERLKFVLFLATFNITDAELR